MNKKFFEFINDPLVIALKKYIMAEDIPQIIRMERKEVVYNKCLEWLFDSNRNKEFGTLPIKLFLKMLSQVDFWDKVVSSTATENPYNEDGIIDLVLDCKLEDGSIRRVCIENKIDSNTHHSQLHRYYNIYKEENPIFCILAPNPKNLKEKHPAFQEITYQNLMDKVLVPLKNINDLTIIHQIIHAMECPSSKGKDPIAMSTFTADQIKAVLEEYEDFMLKVLHMSYKRNEAEIQDLLKVMKDDTIPSTTGIYLYLPTEKDNEGKDNLIGPFKSYNTEMLRGVATLLIHLHNITNEDELKNSPLAQMKIGDIELYSLVKKSTSYYKTPLEVKGEQYKDINGKIYIYNQIRTLAQQENFIAALKNLGFRIIQNI